MIDLVQPDTTIENLESGQEVAKTRTLKPCAQKPSKKSFPKTHKEFWKPRLERRCYTYEGKLLEVSEYSVRIQHLGKRMGFALGSANADVAAEKARKIFLTIIAKGWAAAEAEFNPEMVVRNNDPTLGDFLQEVERRSDLKPKTLRLYSTYFRKIVSDIFNITSGDARFSYANGRYADWKNEVDRKKLNAITPEKVDQWRRHQIKKAGDNPLKRDSATITANSYLRCARALFSKKWLKKLAIRMPAILPFEGVKVEKMRSRRYTSTVDARKLFQDARNELAKDSPAYLIFLLAFGAGLRKGEIDGLEKAHLDLNRGIVSVVPTEFRGLKSNESCAPVEIDEELAAEMKAHLSQDSDFVIKCESSKRRIEGLQHYRAEPVFQRLYTWLRSKGVNARKPLHELRKEFGSWINKEFGLYAAMTALRHADVETTSSHYVDNKQRIALPFSKIVAEPKSDPVNSET